MYPSSAILGPVGTAAVASASAIALVLPAWFGYHATEEPATEKLDAIPGSDDQADGGGEVFMVLGAETYLIIAICALASLAVVFYFFVYRAKHHPQKVASVTTGTFQIVGLKCEGLIDVTDGKRSVSCNPYIEVCVGGVKNITPVHKNEKSPSFSEAELKRLIFPVKMEAGKSQLSLHVFAAKAGDGGLFGLARGPKLLGFADIDIAEIFVAKHGKEVTKSFPLTVDREHESGDVVWRERKGIVTVTGVYRPTVPQGK
jgi:hypothetical protein